jgi:hypothetical protein
MKTGNANSGVKWNGWWFVILLVAVLAVLFWRSFLPGYVHFANDATLGVETARYFQPAEGLTGFWGDLESIGSGGGAYPPSLTLLIRWLSGAVGYGKFLAPVALFILGLGAWTFFRQARLSPLAAVLGGLAAALSSTFFSRACWGIATHPMAVGMDFFALALVVSNTPQTPALTRWVRLALAGMAVGINVMEAADVGAILSLFVAAFVFYKALGEEGVPVLKKIGGGALRVAVLAIFAGFIATQTIQSLVGSAITGVVGTSQDKETKAAHWDFATQWSLPKKETLGLLVPGLFGYRMDTPKDMMPALQAAYQGGEYWGGAGREPAIDRYFDKIFQPGDMVKINFPDDASQNVALTIGPDGNVNLPLLGQTKLAGISGLKLLETVDSAYASRGIKAAVESPGGTMRFNGDGHYLGILVALLAAFSIAQSLRRENSPFTAAQKKIIWFWTAVIFVALLLAWGRFAPFYQFFYALPYVSTIRNPDKFLFVCSWAVVILSGYGVHALSRRYLEVPAGNPASSAGQRTKDRNFNRKWTAACAIAVGVSLLAWLVYAGQESKLIRYLQMVGFPDTGTAKQIATFSLGQAGWFILIFAMATGLFTLAVAGFFSGQRARLGGILLGALLVVDLGRADLPWIIHQNYAQKYASNPIIDFLQKQPYEYRVADLRSETLFEELYRMEWVQHHFLYYNIQTLDVMQMPRMPADLAAFEGALSNRNPPDTTYLIARRWQLTNTRYLLGPAAYLDSLNTQIDPEQHRFLIQKRFSVVPKPGVDVQELQQEFQRGEWRGEKLTAVPDDSGEYALFEFTGALPRVKLYANWQVSTNDAATLQTLADKHFDPLQTVLVSTPLATAPSTNGNSGTVGFKSYAPKDIVFDAKADTASVLLLNDKFDPNWRVTVDGQPAELLRCNFIMRGVYLTPGAHTVEFQFSVPNSPLYVSFAAVAIGIFLGGLLVFLTRRNGSQSPVG